MSPADGALPADPTGPLAIGVDVGGTKTAVVVTDERDRLFAERTVPTERAGLADQLITLVRGTVEDLDAPAARVMAVGLAVPGHVDRRRGTVRLAVNLSEGEMQLAALVREGTGLPTVVEHDVRAAAAWLYDRDRTPNLAYLSVGTGIAAGLVVGGRLVEGATGLAGEVGHVVADPNGPICTCGLRGCLEAVAAGPAIARLFLERSTAAGTDVRQDVAAGWVFEAATHRDPIANEVVATVAAHLARAVRALVLGFGVERVVIGGGVAGAGEALLQPILHAIDEERRVSALVDAAMSTITIELLSPDLNAGARGAAAIARSELLVT
jgi:glucokinase